MDKLEFSKHLEERTELFTDAVFVLCQEVPKTQVNLVITGQLARSGGSVGANYIEANESLSKKDFYHRIRICRKEAKESRYWLRRLFKQNSSFVAKIEPLVNESSEFVLIFSKILTNA